MAQSHWPIRAPRPCLHQSSLAPRSPAAALIALVLALLYTQFPAPARAQPGFQQRTFAIVGATLEIHPGEIIENGTVVIRDGLIVAAGRHVEPPADAEVIDGEDLFVYAGFIDAATSDLIDTAKPPAPAEGRKLDVSRYALAATPPDNRHSLTPDFQATEALKVETAVLDAARKAGFTALHLVPSGRIASGQAALLSTNADPLREILLRDKTAAEFQLFAPGGNQYPSTLMGAIAHLRQAFLDADRHAVHQKLYAEGLKNIGRPPVDPVLDALIRVREQQQPALFLANTRDEIHRALAFADEHQIPATLWGGKSADEAIERLTEANVSLLLQIDFGDEPKVEDAKPAGELTADAKEPLRVQEFKRDEWRRRTAVPAVLHKHGIRFAFSSRGLKNRGDLFKHIRQAIDAGLPHKAALAALTSDAAVILGLENRLGTLAPGRLAHVVVMTGPFDHEQAKTRYVFVDGRKHEFNTDAKPVGPAVAEKPASSPKGASDEGKDSNGAQPENRNPVQISLDDGNDRDTGNDLPVAVAEKPGDEKAAVPLPTELPTDRRARPVVTGGNVFIAGATILTGTGETLENASILVRDGKIAAIGPNLKADEGMAVIDAAGRFVMPGIIDTHSHIMISGGINEATLSIVPEVRVRDIINTDDDSEYRALAGGVTAARIFHGSANTIGGQDAVVKLKYGTTAAEHILHDAPQGVKFALGENVKFRTGRFPNTRMGVEATLNRAFLEAVDYRREWMEYEKKVKAAGDDGAKLLPPRRDLRLEALADIVNHQKFIHSHCYRSDEILMLLRVTSNLGIRIWSLQHVLEGYKVAPEIVAHGASCSTFADWWAYKVEAFDAIPHNAALLKEAGANVVIKSDDWELIRHLYLEAAKTVRYGNMDPQHAIQAITLNPARELGLDSRIGSLEVGKDADIGIYSGHPLNAFSRCEMTLVEGDVYFSRQHAPTAMSEEAVKRSASPPALAFSSPDVRARTLDVSAPASGRFAIVGATLYPVDGPEILDGTLLVDGEKITAVGPKSEIKVPTDARVIDGTGLHVSPGFIDAGTTLGLVEIGKVRETHDYSEVGFLQPDLRAGVALNPDSELLPVARAGGITTILIRPTGGTISGQASLAKLAGWTAPEMILDYEAGLQINWPVGDKAKSLMDELTELLKQAREYDRLCELADAKKIDRPIADPRFEALRPYLKGDKRVFIEASSRKEIAEALLFAEKEKLKIVITGGADAWKLAGELKQRDVPVIVGPVMRKPVSDHDPFDAPYANPGRLYEAGVKFCIRSDSASNSRNAPFEAAQAAAYGLPVDVALRSVTLSSAELLGLADRTGSLTPGKLANLVVSDGPPLQLTSQIKAVFVEGTPYNLETRQTRFYDRYRQRILEAKTKPAADLTAGEGAN